MGKLFLVTGEKGFIGRNLTSYMDEQGISYTTSDWKDTHSIIHLSAFTNARESILNPQECFSKNVKGTFDILLQTTKWKIPKIVFTSPIGVSNPQSPYLASKVAGEAYCSAFNHSYNINTHIARLSNVYGPCSEFKDSIIVKFIKCAIKKEIFYIHGNGTQTRDFIYVGDVVKSLFNITTSLSFITSGITTSVNELISILMELSKKYLSSTPLIKHREQSSKEILRVCEIQGISNPTPLNIGLEKTFKWFIEHL